MFIKSEIGIFRRMQENDVDMRHIVLVPGRRGQLFPGRIRAECFPVLFAGGHIVEAGHVHEIGHVAAGQDAGIEDGVEAQTLEEWYFSPFVEHLYLVGEIFFGGPFIAAQLVDPFRPGPLQGGGYGMMRHLGEGFEEDRFHSKIGCAVVSGVLVIQPAGVVLLIFCEGGVQTGELFEAFEGYQHIDATDSGGVVPYRFEYADIVNSLPVKGGNESVLQVIIYTGFLFGRIQLIDADGIEFLFGCRGGGGENTG